MLNGTKVCRKILFIYSMSLSIFNFVGLGGFMACLATLQSTVEKPKELEESSSDDSFDGTVNDVQISQKTLF